MYILSHRYHTYCIEYITYILYLQRHIIHIYNMYTNYIYQILIIYKMSVMADKSLNSKSKDLVTKFPASTFIPQEGIFGFCKNEHYQTIIGSEVIAVVICNRY